MGSPEEDGGDGTLMPAVEGQHAKLLPADAVDSAVGPIPPRLQRSISVEAPAPPARATPSVLGRLTGGLEARLLSWSGGGDGGGGAAAVGDLAAADGRAPPAAAFRALYASHALARWAWRTWEFAVVLILLHLHPGSLLLVSGYGLMDNLVRVVAGAAVGRYIDRTERLPGATAMYLLQNGCILTSAAAAAALIWLARGGGRVAPQIYWPLMCVVVFVGSSGSVGSVGAAAAVEREWVKALCGGDTALLSRVNSVMRAIDMLCLLLSPAAAGFLMTFVGMLPAVAAIWVFSAVAWLPECALLRVAHALAPELRRPKTASAAPAPPPRSRIPFAALVDGWGLYMAQPTLLPALALALLYLTASLSVFRGAGAISGLLATFIFPRLHAAAGLEASGCAGISWLNACLLVGAVPTVAATLLGTPLGGAAGGSGGGPPPPLLLLLLCGLVASRLGVWLFDLAVSQLQQEMVPPDELGAVSGVQSSMQSLFEIASFVAGSALHRPDQFHWLMLGSCCAVASAGLLYLAYLARHRGGEGGGCCGAAMRRLAGRRQPYARLGEGGGGGGGAVGGGAGGGGAGGGDGRACSAALTIHFLGVGNSNGQNLVHTIDTGSGLLLKNCGGAPFCPKKHGKLFTPTKYWDGCLSGPTCGYAAGFSPSPANVFDGVYILSNPQTGAPTCNFSVILEPSNSQGNGPVATDSMNLFNVTPKVNAKAKGKPVVELPFALVACTWTGDRYVTGSDVSRRRGLGERGGGGGNGEAGHDRDIASIPTMIFNNGLVPYDAFAMCQFDQAETSQMSCKGNKLRNSYMIYGNAVPAPAPNVTLQQVPLLTPTELSGLLSSGAIQWSLYNQSRMDTRYLAEVENIVIKDWVSNTEWANIKYVEGGNIVNLDTGAYMALQVGKDAHDAFVSAVKARVAQLNGTDGFDIVRCPSGKDGRPICGGNANPDPDTGCLMINVPKQKNAREQEAAAAKASELLAKIFPTMTATFTNGATATLTTATPSNECKNKAVLYCSYPSASNGGIVTNLWWANTFFNDRFVQFDRKENVVNFSPQGVNACASGFVGVA
ncbi:hypothetical protein Rsub_11825 [Raphidocelis subcapitata]|uniref:Solute carrier family 40 protein n=1 Tax=Raphidocelis subcapitata TaxID=307507 RepID=A0A2V0PGR7_9CHLO|nr:hypothetical protein Rsub_11825 [Raphidocelis subcapitata]|eukprot:GBF99021.1 hypothetical protein Rsub_11825 [Raphidocelis subcapitata]